MAVSTRCLLPYQPAVKQRRAHRRIEYAAGDFLFLMMRGCRRKELRLDGCVIRDPSLEDAAMYDGFLELSALGAAVLFVLFVILLA